MCVEDYGEVVYGGEMIEIGGKLSRVENVKKVVEVLGC